MKISKSEKKHLQKIYPKKIINKALKEASTRVEFESNLKLYLEAYYKDLVTIANPSSIILFTDHYNKCRR